MSKEKMIGVMSKKEAIEELGCRDKQCSFFQETGGYTFCKALTSENFCRSKTQREKNKAEKK